MFVLTPNRLFFANRQGKAKIADLWASQSMFEHDMYDRLAQKSAAGHTHLMGWLFGDVSSKTPLEAFRKHAEQCREEDRQRSEMEEAVADQAEQAHTTAPASDHEADTSVIVKTVPSMQPTSEVVDRLMQPLQHTPSPAMVRLITHHYHLFLDQFMLRHVLVHHADLLSDVADLSRATAWAHASDSEAFSAFWADFYVAWRAMHPKGMHQDDETTWSEMQRAFAAEAQRASKQLDDQISHNPNLARDFVRGIQDRAIVQPTPQPQTCPKQSPDAKAPRLEGGGDEGAAAFRPVPGRVAQQNVTQQIQQTEYFTLFNRPSVPRPQTGQGG